MISFVNHSEKKVIVAFRGTILSHVSDIIHDASLAVGRVLETSFLAKITGVSHRFNSALNFTKQAAS